MPNEDDPTLNSMLRQIFHKGRIDQIKWEWEEDGENTWSTERRLTYACDLASAMNQAADVLQKERFGLLGDLEMANKKVAAAEHLQSIDHGTLAEVITKHNAERQADAKLIQSLQSRVKTQDEVIEALNNGDER